MGFRCQPAIRILAMCAWCCACGVGSNTVRATDTVSDLIEAVRTPVKAAEAKADKPTAEKKKSQKQDCDSSDFNRSCQEGSDCSDQDDGLGLFVAAGIGYVIASPFWGPPLMIGDHYTLTGRFTEYPYAHHDGYMVFYLPDPKEEPWPVHSNSLQFESNYESNFSGQELIGGRVLAETSWRLGLDTRFNYLQDDRRIADQQDVWLGDANFVYRFAQSEQWQVRAGLGMNWLADERGEDLGVNFTYQADWFPVQPWVLSSEVDIGTLGDAWLFDFHTSVGVTWHGVEARVGYEYLDIGSAQFNFFTAGVRLWF